MIPQLPNNIKQTDYWFFKIQGVEWMYVLGQLMKGFPPSPAETTMFMIMMADGNHFYALKKQYVPATEISRQTGLSVPDIEGLEVIVLNVKPTPELPRPTVDGWGTA